MKSRLFLYTSSDSHRNQAFRHQVKQILERLEISCPFMEVDSLEDAMFSLADEELPALVLDETIICRGSLPSSAQLIRDLSPLLSQKIVVPTDFSKASQAALLAGMTLGEKWSTGVTALHVQSGLVYADHPLVIAPVEDMGNALKSRLANFVATTQSKQDSPAAPSVKSEVMVGAPILSIATVSREPETVLMVQSIEGLSAGIGIGPIAGRLLERSDCPVLFIKEEVSGTHFDQLLIATDYTNISELVLGTLQYYVTTLGSQLHFVHVLESDRLDLDDAQAEQAKLRARLEAKGFPEDKIRLTILDGGHIGEALDHYAFEHNIDVQVMVHTRRSIWGRLFAPSMTRKELRSGYCSVLVLKE